MNNWAVQTKALCKNYGEKRAVTDLNLEVPAGSVFALLGLNGAGKSTILKMLMGLIHPSSGEGFCLGMDIRTRGMEIRQKVGYMGEETRMYGYMNVHQAVRFCSGLYGSWDDGIVKEYMDTFQIPGQARLHQLSQGQKNQLALILALAPRPDLLLLDEPTTGFDPVKRRLFFNAVLREMVAEGKTVLLASHHLEDVERVADQVGLMHRGRLVHTCSLDELRAREKEIRVVFQKEPPADLFRHPGIVQVKQEGMAYRITISDGLEEIWQSCSSFPHYALDVISADLEDIFLRYTEEGWHRD
ncbi:MAG: ABC transporter ATP-binding protein [Bacillota bacterium]